MHTVRTCIGISYEHWKASALLSEPAELCWFLDDVDLAGGHGCRGCLCWQPMKQTQSCYSLLLRTSYLLAETTFPAFLYVFVRCLSLDLRQRS